MSRLEKRNLVILVAVLAGLIVGAGVFANYTGILQAEARQQSQSKSSCSRDKALCPAVDKEASNVAGVFASVEASEAEGACPVYKNEGCKYSHAADCDKEAGCEKQAGCGKAKLSGCCGATEHEGACEAQKESTT